MGRLNLVQLATDGFEFINLCASNYNEKLIAIYQRVIKAFKGKKFFRLNKVMKELADIDIE